MNITATKLPDVKIIEPVIFSDERGFFMEVWQRKKFAEAGIEYDFVQDNVSHSVHGTLRGLHYQLQQPQGKLVRVSTGVVFDVAVDIRKLSPTFGKWVGRYLSSENRHMLWIPPGFAHGFYVISDIAEVHYKCTDYYAPEFEHCIRWDDSTIGIQWPIEESPILSDKDLSGLSIDKACVYE
jgi:dTDP-4-dehydrorhamnose 3,5-epimerase